MKKLLNLITKKVSDSALYVYHTKLGKLIFFCVLSAIFGMIYTHLDMEWAYYVAMLCWTYPVGLSLLLIAHAWIINPYNSWKKKKNK